VYKLILWEGTIIVSELALKFATLGAAVKSVKSVAGRFGLRKVSKQNLWYKILRIKNDEYISIGIIGG